jgi:GMP synthase-like glutamine amidotransferase|tara:strand:+ start:342 stop:968 length:627 start_codon:yes stop_codon:yes gene_type:complete
MAKGKILLIDNYKQRNTTHIEQIEAAIKKAGYDVGKIRHSEAKGKEDILEGYDGYVSSGSGKTWEKSGRPNKQGKQYLKSDDPVHKNLAAHKKPGYHICAGMDELANALGYKVQDTGKFNRGTGEDGHHYNHKYALRKEDTDNRINNVKTFNHAGEEYVSSFDIGNKRAVKYHSERTEKGIEELTGFLDSHIGGKEPLKQNRNADYKE